MATAAYFIGMQIRMSERPRVVIEAIPASNDVNLPGLATTETLTRHVNLNYFSEAVSWEGEERLADADSWRITGNPQVIVLGRISIDKRAAGQEIEHRIMLSPRQLEAAFHGEKQTQTNP